MATIDRKSKQIAPAGVAVGDRERVEDGSGKDVPPARQRVRYNKAGEELTGPIGTRFPKDLYEEYKRIAFFRGVNVRDLIGEAMKTYRPELKKGYTQRLKDAGMTDLDFSE